RISRSFEERRGPPGEHETQRPVALLLAWVREVHRNRDPAPWHRWRPPVGVRPVMPVQRGCISGIAVLGPAGREMNEGCERCAEEASIALRLRDRTWGYY